jgi:hypothetical protein
MTGSSVWATLTINGTFCVSLMALFEYYRMKVTDLYAPRSRGSNPKYKWPRPGWFEWIPQMQEISDDEMFRIAGMDGYVFLRFLLFGAKLCTICAPFAVLVLIPIYATSPGGALNGLDISSMANIPSRDGRLWAPFMFIYLFTFVFLYLIHKEYENFVVMRKRYFRNDVDVIPLQTRYTVQVENIPPDLRSGEKLFQVFDMLFPNEVIHAHIAVMTPELDQLIAERDSVRDQLERAVARYEGSGRRDRPVVGVQRPGKKIKKRDVDSISFLKKRLHRLCDRVARLQKAILESGEERMVDSPRSPLAMGSTRSLIPTSDHVPRRLSSADIEQAPPLDGLEAESRDSYASDEESVMGGVVVTSGLEMFNPLQEAPRAMRKFSIILQEVKQGISALFISTTGFVTFKSRKAQLTAVRTSILLEEYPLMTVQAAPPPLDMIWSNISASTQATEQTAVFSAGAYYGCLAFWGGVMAFVAAVSTMSTLETYLPFLRDFDYMAYAIVEGLLPVVVVILFSMMVSGTIAYIARYVEKRKTNSAVEMEVFKW